MKPLNEHLSMVSIRLIDDVPLLSDKQLNSPMDAVNVLRKYISDFDRELLCVVNLSSSNMPINGNIVSMGTLNGSLVEPREVFKTAILSNAAKIIVMHNHPSGYLNPSKDDIMVTDRLLQAGELLGIPLVDHIIVGPHNSSYFSFHEKEIISMPSLRYEQDYRCLSFDAKAVAEQ